MTSSVPLLLLAAACVAAAGAATIPTVPAVPWDESLPAVQSRIVSGHPATANQFPYQVSVRIITPQGAAVCGGSLVHPRWVLCAAHCTINRNQFVLRFGSLNMNSGGHQQTATRAINHPQFNPQNLNNDVSLIEVPSAVPLSAAVATVRLPTRSQASATFNTYLTTVSGWGAVTHGGPAQALLRWVNVRVITNAVCAQTYGGGVVQPFVLCTTGTGGNQGTCGGDSGGPLVLNEGGVPTQVGIVAFGAPDWRGGCSAGFPSGFMRTGHYLAWIQQHTGVAIRG